MFLQGVNSKKVFYSICLVAFILFMTWLGWVGYYGSDDYTYYDGAIGWLRHFPYVGDSHWTLRHTLVIPMAATFALFGINEVTLVIPTLTYYYLLLCLVFLVVRRNFGLPTALTATFLIATLPLMAIQSTLVVPDFAEVLFCLASLFLFIESISVRYPRRLLVLAGVFAGFAWLTRETVVYLLVAYFIMFVFGFGHSRKRYFLMLPGFFFLVLMEFGYFTVMTGDPFHRIVVDLRTHLGADIHSGIDTVVERVEDAAEKSEGVRYGPLARTGNLSVNRFIDPILAVLANQEFMFFYYFAFPLALWTAWKYRGNNKQNTWVRVALISASVWLFFIYAQIGTTLLPRYYMFPTVVISIIFSIWLVRYLLPRSRAAFGVVLFFFMSTGIAGTYIDNRNPIFAERQLTDYVQTVPEAIYTDPSTARRGRFLYQLAGVEERVIAGLPTPGSLFFYNPTYVKYHRMLGMTEQVRQRHIAEMKAYLPKDTWQLVWQKEPDRKFFGVLLEALGLQSLVPDEIFRRLDRPNFPVFVYRVPAK